MEPMPRKKRKNHAKPTLQPDGKIRHYKRTGPVTPEEKLVVAHFIAAQKQELSAAQERGLAQTLNRSTDMVKRIIDEAKLTFVERAGRYVDLHMETVETALANGDAKSLEVARRGSEWAIEHASMDGHRVVEAEKVAADTGVKIVVGVQVGGAVMPNTQVIEVAPVSPQEPV